ncbi:uncharacterized protein G2W53_027606 [Senna tora]|uniref:Uncharacterized protein n=1 Tax=Senna tora TaxID=362788 RepID=A0A834TJC0_9FABA|nr:uncharacterized protein G2W53_027606 [Senna tora]
MERGQVRKMVQIPKQYGHKDTSEIRVKHFFDFVTFKLRSMIEEPKDHRLQRWMGQNSEIRIVCQTASHSDSDFTSIVWVNEI